LQEAFDYMMARMIENGENVFRTIASETDLDVDEEGGGIFRDGDEMNGLPISTRWQWVTRRKTTPTAWRTIRR
jgi:hypothetical protein